MIKIQTKQIISLQDWDALVEKTYGKPYSFQQQDGCQGRGTRHITIPDEDYDFENDTIPEEVNGDQMGVSFKAWLARDVNEWNVEYNELNKSFMLSLFWSRNFYPELQTVANDLYEKGLIPAGEYGIEIDW